jgi:hypothetical protein
VPKRRRLLPALLRLGEAGAPAATRAQALRYVHFALDRLQCQVLLPMQGCVAEQRLHIA